MKGIKETFKKDALEIDEYDLKININKEKFEQNYGKSEELY